MDRCVGLHYENACVCAPLLRTQKIHDPNATLPVTSLIFSISKLCKWVCLYSLVYVCVYVHVYVYAYVYICMRMRMQPRVSLCVCEYVCVCVRVRVYLSKRSQISVARELRDKKKGFKHSSSSNGMRFSGGLKEPHKNRALF